ncbi:DUF2254 domain-containing protein [Vitiosangium sp. GDMCC 1.1324]|uniref:DUF2254 domain-containing protein n=1 Tax=Vitiosangium sp. (strain GDMCC 1.1324) TaxID=2138576 RepID=UPI000D37FCF2|nr:DUF2254 domain-containing protein [Vitiosangium sp. GDMCC 1.1324]PTL84857.1 hypothetical protein DAT35_07320 [Vitiosangium sp. GDMCC 1.1324]
MRRVLRFRAAEWWRTNLWLIPLLCSVLAAILERNMVRLDQSLQVPEALSFSEGSSLQLLAVGVGAMISLLGIVFAFFVLVLQAATGQLSPRILSIWYRDRPLKATLGIIAAALVYNFLLMTRQRAGFVPNLSILVGALLVVASIVAFLGFLQHVVRNLRPVAMADIITDKGLQAIQQQSRPWNDKAPVSTPITADDEVVRLPSQVVTYSGPGRVLGGLDTEGLVADARRADCILVLSVAVGDYVHPGTPLARVYGARASLSEKTLLRRLVLGRERQLKLDPLFSLRLLVDIAIRALSPSINDPTTAVEMLDRLGTLLHMAAHRHLGMGALRDENGHLRLLLLEPRWEDFVTLGVTEIRHYGQDAPQVTRRLHALLRDLEEEVPPERRPALEHELELLAGSANTGEDADLSREEDPQGFGPSRSPSVPPSLH